MEQVFSIMAMMVKVSAAASGVRIRPTNGCLHGLSNTGVRLDSTLIEGDCGCLQVWERIPWRKVDIRVDKTRTLDLLQKVEPPGVRITGLQLARLAWPVEANSLGARLPKAL